MKTIVSVKKGVAHTNKDMMLHANAEIRERSRR